MADNSLPPIQSRDLEALDRRLKQLERRPRSGESSSVEVPLGGVLLWLDDTAPGGFLILDGGSLVGYPRLAQWFGDRGMSTTVLPDWRGRMPIGADGTFGLGSTGGAADGHHHAIPTGANVVTDGAGGPGADITTGGAGYVLQSTVGTGSADGDAAGSNMGPWVGVNWIIRHD
jgi:microcystin-dependent protein